MATNNPVTVTSAWTSVISGTAWNGALQNLSGVPVVGFVTDTIGTPPAAGHGGFEVTNTPIPFGITATQQLWCRAVGDSAVVILA